jgi:Rrf2 family protein
VFVPAKTEYACLALLELAARHGHPKPIRLSEVADRHGLKKPFLVQILLDLKGAGLVASTRGKTGGYHLTRDPDQINLWDVLEVVDRQEEPSDERRRQLTPSVLSGALQSVWRRISAAREDILRGTTLADLLPEDNGADYVI